MTVVQPWQTGLYHTCAASSFKPGAEVARLPQICAILLEGMSHVPVKEKKKATLSVFVIVSINREPRLKEAEVGLGRGLYAVSLSSSTYDCLNPPLVCSILSSLTSSHDSPRRSFGIQRSISS